MPGTNVHIAIVAPTQDQKSKGLVVSVALADTVKWARLMAAEFNSRSTLLEGDAATRAQLESSCGEEVSLAFWGHGDEDELVAQAFPDALNASAADLVYGPAILKPGESRFRFPWVFAMACRSAEKLGPDAALRPGVFVGFNEKLVLPKGDVDGQTAEMINLVLCLPRALAHGERDEKEMRKRMRRLAKKVIAAKGSRSKMSVSMGVFVDQLQAFVMCT